MAPKEKPSKKNAIKKQDQTIEDRTFGMKNKNKSKKVQSFIQGVEKSVKNSTNKDAVKTKEEKQNIALAKKLKEEELRLLFNDGLTNQFGKKKAKTAEEANALGLNEQIIDVDALSLSDSSEEEEDDDIGDDTVYKEDNTPEAVEVFREKTIEDVIEEQRAKLAAEGKVGTPVTEASFAKWQAEKKIKKQQEAEARLKAEHTKKKGGKGLSVLSGKELFNFNAALFVDDDGAIDETEELALSAETKAREAEEERRMEAERERAQAEQLRLAEVQRLEDEARRHRDDARRQAARSNLHLFQVDGVTVNRPIFDIEEYEDLTPFGDDDALVMSIDADLFDQDVDEDDLELADMSIEENQGEKLGGAEESL